MFNSGKIEISEKFVMIQWCKCNIEHSVSSTACSIFENQETMLQRFIDACSTSVCPLIRRLVKFKLMVD